MTTGRLQNFGFIFGITSNSVTRRPRNAGLEPKQYQLLLAIRGLPEESQPTVGVLANRLGLRHHSAVELVQWAETNLLVQRKRAGTHVFVALTKQGERLLASAVNQRLKELQTAGPVLVKSLQKLIRGLQTET